MCFLTHVTETTFLSMKTSSMYAKVGHHESAMIASVPEITHNIRNGRRKFTDIFPQIRNGCKLHFIFFFFLINYFFSLTFFLKTTFLIMMKLFHPQSCFSSFQKSFQKFLKNGSCYTPAKLWKDFYFSYWFLVEFFSFSFQICFYLANEKIINSWQKILKSVLFIFKY